MIARCRALPFLFPLMLGACDLATHSAPSLSEPSPDLPRPATDSLPPPPGSTGPGPVLIHTGAHLSAYPGEPVSESLYVANAVPGRWRLTLAEAPAGTTLEGGIITYRLTEGLEGPQPVRAVAVSDTDSLELAWTVRAFPVANSPPILEEIHPPDWVLPDQPFLRILRAVDPDGDSLRFEGTLPAGANLKEGELEWTPTSSQAGPNRFRIRAIDTHGHADSIAFTVQVLGFDPWPFTASPIVGRIWRIRGYTCSRDSAGAAAADPLAADSVAFNRTVTLVSRLPENVNLVFRVRDTLDGARREIRDTVYSITFQEGSDFTIGNLAGMIPFAWPANATVAENIRFPIGDSSYSARKELNDTPCPTDAEWVLGGCGTEERVFAEGWGLVHVRSEHRNAGSTVILREEFTVQELYEPAAARKGP